MGRGIPMMLTLADNKTYNAKGTEVMMEWKLKGEEHKALAAFPRIVAK